MTGWTTLRAVFANELRALWLSPLGWGFVGTALLLGGWLLQLSLASTGEASLRGWLPNFAVTLLFCMPLLTMRTVAGERRRGTLELLMSAPVSLGSVIVGKWLGVVATCALMLVLTTPFAAALAWVGDPDWGTVLTTYLGLAACCGLFAAVGIFASAVAPEPMVAGLITVALLLPTWLAGAAGPLVSGPARAGLARVSLGDHLRSFARGVLDSGDVAWFGGFTFLFLFFAWRALEAQRWR